MALSLCRTTVDDSARELMEHGTAAFPIACYHDDLQAEPVPWHWHEELELIYVQKGAVTYHTPQVSLRIEEKNGLFTNSNVLHQVLSSEPDSEIFYKVFMFRKNFLAEEGSYLDKKYVSPLLQANAASSLLLSQSDPARKKILEQLLELSELNQIRPFGYDMKSRNLMSDIWLHIAE